MGNLKELSQQPFTDEDLLPPANRPTHQKENSAAEQPILTPEQQQCIAQTAQRPYDGRQVQQGLPARTI